MSFMRKFRSMKGRVATIHAENWDVCKVGPPPLCTVIGLRSHFFSNFSIRVPQAVGAGLGPCCAGHHLFPPSLWQRYFYSYYWPCMG